MSLMPFFFLLLLYRFSGKIPKLEILQQTPLPVKGKDKILLCLNLCVAAWDNPTHDKLEFFNKDRKIMNTSNFPLSVTVYRFYKL